MFSPVDISSIRQMQYTGYVPVDITSKRGARRRYLFIVIACMVLNARNQVLSHLRGWSYWNSPGEWPKARAVASAIKQATVTTSRLNVYIHEVE